MTEANSRVLHLLLFAALCLPGLGQGASSQKPLSQMPPTARQLIAIKVTGSKRFPEEVIAAATGLQMGAAVSDDDFKAILRIVIDNERIQTSSDEIALVAAEDNN